MKNRAAVTTVRRRRRPGAGAGNGTQGRWAFVSAGARDKARLKSFLARRRGGTAAAESADTFLLTASPNELEKRLQSLDLPGLLAHADPERLLQILEFVDLTLETDPLTAEETRALEDDSIEPGGLSAATPEVVRKAEDEYGRLIRGSLTVEQAAERLHVNPSRIRQRLGACTLYGFRVDRGWRIPRFQFQEDRVIPGLADVLVRVPHDLHPVAVSNWLQAPNAELVVETDGDEIPLAPLQWLAAGYSADAVSTLAAQL